MDRISRTSSAVDGWSVLISDSVHPVSLAKWSHTTFGLPAAAFSSAGPAVGLRVAPQLVVELGTLVQAGDAVAQRLGLRPMVEQNRSRHGTNFTVSIEAKEGISTGISAADFYLAVPAAVVRFLESDSQTKTVAKPQLRGTEGQKVTLGTS